MSVLTIQESVDGRSTAAARRPVWSRILRFSASVLFVVLVLAMMGVGVGAVLGYRLSPVLSGSMRPAYAPGDAVIMRPIPVTSVRPGMIIEFIPPGQTSPFTHRVVNVAGDPTHPLIRTKGDANAAPDSWRVQLNGPEVNQVVGSVPYFGRAMVFAHQPGALLALVGLIVTGGGLVATVSLYRRETGALAAHPTP